MAGLSPVDWLTVVRREYLDDFVPAGGAAVKFVVPHPPITREQLREALRAAAEDNGFQFVYIDSATTRIHLIDRLFHDIARQLDWDSLVYAYLSRFLSEQGYTLPDSRDRFSLSALADLNDREEPSLRQDIRREIEKGVFLDYEMSQEFRYAMIGLCRNLLDPGYDPVSSAIKDWLLGDPARLSSLKSALIFQRIARHNARHMLTSLTHWLKLAGKKGLVLGLDITRYVQAVRPADRDETNFYSTAAALDAYEVLRQLVDGTDELTSCFIAVIAGPEFLSDDRRGVRGY
ncbi:MAG: hypothetical protein HW416_2151, partial [Chloroflexi bacterium]|nr:hypothetical protein [Chloroflexota bacterium]